MSRFMDPVVGKRCKGALSWVMTLQAWWWSIGCWQSANEEVAQVLREDRKLKGHGGFGLSKVGWKFGDFARGPEQNIFRRNYH
jgi:hypothetical protein